MKFKVHTCKLTLIKYSNTHLYRPEKKKKNSYKKEIFIGFDSANLLVFVTWTCGVKFHLISFNLLYAIFSLKIKMICY